MGRLYARRTRWDSGRLLLLLGAFAAARADAAQALPVGADVLTPSARVSTNGSTAGRTDPAWLGRWTARGGGVPREGSASTGQIDPSILNNGIRPPWAGNIPSNALRVALTAPAGGAEFAAHSELVLMATTTGQVTSVEFYDGAVGLGPGLVESRFNYRLALTDGLNAGTHVLRVKATDAHGLIVWSPAIVITVLAPPQAAPDIALIEPVAGAVYSAGSSIMLRAAITGSGDRLTRVEFYDGRELIASVPVAIPESDAKAGSAEYVSPAWIADAPGTHRLHVRAYAGSASFSGSPPVPIKVVPALPYVASFEAREKYRPGSLGGQLGWKIRRGSAVISEAAAFDGTQAVELSGGATGGRVDQVLGAPALLQPIFVDLAVRAAAGATRADGTTLDFDGARVTFVAEGSSGRFAVPRNGGRDTAIWTPVGQPVALGAGEAAARWSRLTLRLDDRARVWDLFIDGRLAGFDLALDRNDVSLARPRRLSFRSGAGTTASFDYLLVGFENPLFADADADGMEDAWERANALDPARDDRAGDRDADGLSNLAEYFRGTRADLADTDADGLPDAWEIRSGLDPLRPAGESSDADLDGLNDLREFMAGTDPANPDSEGDGLPDGWEATHGLDPLRADSSEDSDQDGVSNLEEYRRGTDPTDFFDGLPPRLEALHEGKAGADDEIALLARKPDGTPWADAPVTFRITAGSRRLAANVGRGPYANVIELRADANGLARVYLEPLEP